MEEAGNQGAMGSARPAARAPDREQGAPWQASGRGSAGAVRGGAGHLNEQPWGTKEGERQPWRCSTREKKGRAGHGAEASLGEKRRPAQARAEAWSAQEKPGRRELVGRYPAAAVERKGELLLPWEDSCAR
jgi:hypothetical protein